VDVDVAVNGIMMGAFLNSGQVCAAASRIYVHQKIYEKVQRKLQDILLNIKVGDGLDESAQIQPVISKRQQEQILNYFSIAQAEGASILCPDISHLTEGFYVPPAVITNLQVTSRILKEEIFGPVIALVS